MPFVSRKSLFLVAVLAFVATAIVAGFVWSGLYNIGADDAHTRPVYALLETVRERSIQARAGALAVPDLEDADLVRQGAGNYDSMCTGCHLAPGMAPTELSKGLYPQPPAFATTAAGDPRHDFWVIKHGIKASGMPAWGPSMDDRYVWGMVAFLQRLPGLDAAQYRALVASSGGHSHGGGESPAQAAPADAAAAPHAHPPGTAAEHHDAAPATITHTHADGTVESHPAPAPAAAPATITHTHADGTVESHPAPAATPAAQAEANAEAAHDPHPHDH
jgi:hypothetical protein